MTPSQPIRVVLVDDHAVVRAGLQYFLASTSDIVVVGEAGDGAQALVVVNELQPDVVVLDLMMPKVDGITALTQLHEGHPHVRVLMLTSFVEGPLIQQALQLGACGYLLKDAAGEELAAAIRTAYAGRSVLGAAATQALIRAVRAAHAGRGSDGARARGVGHAGQRTQQQANRGACSTSAATRCGTMCRIFCASWAPPIGPRPWAWRCSMGSSARPGRSNKGRAIVYLMHRSARR